ncbi:YheC/YheD family protein [Sporosarcina koreensis]|uniref:YheC/YheD family protein n=1 Tax=Sporosarcina koreensis TaxID=334735 RepID=A0ABW0TWE2_9BACL
MKGIRGRYGQHRILESENGISMHLLELKLMSASTFFYFIEKYTFFIIKPLLGPQEIGVAVNEVAIEVATGSESIQFSTKEKAYDYLNEHICIRKHYVIQAIPVNPSTLSHCRYTLHRKSPTASWKIVNHLLINTNDISDFNIFLKWKLNKFLTSAVKRLGAAFPSCHTIVIEIANNGAGEFWLTDSILHERNSKWSQYHALYRKRSIRPMLPATELCTKNTLLAFLNIYPEVIIKPCVGQQGRGIVKISVTADYAYEVHEKQNRLVKDDYDQLFGYIAEHYLSIKDYIVQQRISLSELNGCPFDVRVITQLDGERWLATGMVVKVAAKDYFVSNRASKLLTMEKAIFQLESGVSSEQCAKWIEMICKKASKRLLKNNGGISIIGFDIGIDSKGAVWIIEGNYAPSLSMFYMFGNNEIHERISYYIKKHKKSD